MKNKLKWWQFLKKNKLKKKVNKNFNNETGEIDLSGPILPYQQDYWFGNDGKECNIEKL